MKKIYKYKFEVTCKIVIEMLVGAEILTVQTQRGSPCIWALVDPEMTYSEKRNFYIFGTGHEITHNSSQLCYIGTFQMDAGDLVFHLFEDKSY